MLIFIALYAVACALSIYCRYNNRFFYQFAKPIPLMMLLCLMFYFRPHPQIFYYFLAGLSLGMLGDILLLSERTFKYGAALFALGHVFYIVCFYWISGWPAPAILMLIFGYTLVYVFFLFRRLQATSGVGKIWMGLPYIFMVSLLLIFGAGTVGHVSPMGVPALFAGLDKGFFEYFFFLGSMLFYASDFVLVWNRYAGEFKAAQFVILTTYYSAQAFIVCGALGHLL